MPSNMIIYKITNNVNGKFYIGKTVKSVEERFQKHRYNHKTQNTYLYKAMRKYGFDHFNIEVIEEINENINERECYWINQLKPHYNMTSGGEGGDTSNSPNFKKAIKRVHLSKKSKDYATYGMLGKAHPGKGKSLKANYCPVICEGITFESVGAAQVAYPGIKISYRLDNPKYPEFYRLQEKTKRK